MVPFHLGEERFAARGRDLAALAGRLAREAADGADRPVRVAASLPPVFGSYAPEAFDPVRAPTLQQVLIEAQAPHADLWLAETVGSCAEATSVLASLARAGVEGERWLALSVADELIDGRPVLWSQESVTDGVKMAIDAGADAVLVNCASPEAISLALPEVVAATESAGRAVPVGAYANAFPPKPAGYSANETVFHRRVELTPSSYVDFARAWVAAGATIVGGCCGIHPEHIAELARVEWSGPTDS